jgi:hypothetical protein
MILLSGIYYGFNECKKDVTCFITGNIPELPEKISKKFTVNVQKDFKEFKLRNISVKECNDLLCSANAEIELESPFPYKIKLKKFEVITIKYQNGREIIQRFYLEKPVTIEANKTTTLELKGYVNREFTESQNYKTELKMEFEVFGVDFEIVTEGW